MTACTWSEQVALHAGGDIEGGDRVSVERHLATCLECRQLFAELQGDRALLAAEPEIPAAVYEKVRAAVVRRSSRRWMPVAAAAGVVLMAAMSWYGYRERQPLERIDVAVAAPAAPAVARSAPVVVRRKVAHPASPVRNRSAEIAMALRELMPEDTSAPVKAEGSVVITAQTDDPSVIIILVPETRGEDYE